MKVKILYTALISLIAGGAMAQDCTFFFPQTEGTVWVRKGYDAKGNLQSVMSYQVDEVETLPSGQEVEADYVYTNPSGTIVNKGDIKAYCQNGEFFLDSKETLSYPGVVSEMNTNVDITENFINYPNPYAANFDKNNVYFDEASVKIYDKKNRKNRKDMAINIATRSPKSKETITGYGYEWYSPNVGLVRTEQYDKNNVLQSYTVLEELK